MRAPALLALALACALGGADAGAQCASSAECADPARPVCSRPDDAGAEGACVECGSDADCAGRDGGAVFCRDGTRVCGECNASNFATVCSTARAGGSCLPTGRCGCTASTDCASRRCDGATRRCLPPEDAGPGDAAVDADASEAAVDAAPDAPAPATAGGGCGCRATPVAPRRAVAALAAALIALASARRRRRG